MTDFDPCPTVMGYSTEPMPPMPSFAPKLVLHLGGLEPERHWRLGALPGQGRKYPIPVPGEKIGAFEVIESFRKPGQYDQFVRIKCECGMVEEILEYNLRKRLRRGTRCLHECRQSRRKQCHSGRG